MKVFLDSNILVYTLVDHDPRQDKAIDLVASGGCVSVQVLNECASVARRKLKMSWLDIADALQLMRKLLAAPTAVTIATHEAALQIVARYQFSFFDALIVAAALEAGCDTLLSEDMQDGMQIDDRLAIRNPFA